MTNWQVIHTVQVVVSGIGVGAAAVAKSTTGNFSVGATAIAMTCTTVVGVLGLYSGAALGPVAAETVRLKSIAPPKP